MQHKRTFHRVCVFCGSNNGARLVYQQAAQELGQHLAERGIGLVYGGGSVGLMGVLADAVLQAGGEVIGVIPQSLATKELAHPAVTEMLIVPSMHVRKARMADLADAFIAMPGGFGTFEELFEVITWAQLGFHEKPIGLLNVAGYFDALLSMVEQAITEGFIKTEHRQLVLVDRSPAALLDALAEHEMPTVRKWITSEEL